MKLIKEQVYTVTYKENKLDYNKEETYYIADSMEEALEIHREIHPTSIVKSIAEIFKVNRKSTKTITVNI